LEPGAVVAAGAEPQMEDAAGSEPPSSCCRTEVRLRLMETLARLPVPDAVGLPLASSEAEAVPHETSTLMRPVSMGSVQFFGVDGVPVLLEPLAIASCVLSRANPLSDDVALVGQGLLAAAVERQAPVPEASARGALVASASEPPPLSCNVLKRPKDTNPPFPWTFHCVTLAPAVEDSAVTTVMATRPTAATRILPIAFPFHKDRDGPSSLFRCD
jgi:hypothetical protein